MNPKKRRRLAFAAAVVLAAAGGTWLVLGALGSNVLYFYSPSDVATQHVGPGVAFRIGGLVEKGSVTHGKGAEVRFKVTDGKAVVPVDFKGVLPDLFREGQGIVAVGKLDAAGTFDATQVLAKHDAKYMPPEVVDALKRPAAGRKARTPPRRRVHDRRTRTTRPLSRPCAVADPGRRGACRCPARRGRARAASPPARPSASSSSWRWPSPA